MYIPNAGLFTQQPQQEYRLPLDILESTPPPPEFQNIAFNATRHTLPCISDMLPQNWNIANNPNVSVMNIQQGGDLGAASSNAMQVDAASGYNSLLDLDNQQDELVNLNSGTLNLLDANNLTDNLSVNLSLSDFNIPPQREENNMTDSLTRLANNTIDSICQLNKMYK